MENKINKNNCNKRENWYRPHINVNLMESKSSITSPATN